MIGASRRTGRGPGRLFVGLGLMAAVALGLGLYLLKPPPRPELARLQKAKLPSGKTAPAPGTPTTKPPAAKTPPAPAPAPAAPAIALLRQPPPGTEGGAPRIAIIIDDLGRNVAAAEKLAGINDQFSFAVMPFESHTPAVVAALHARQLEVLCHLPMEARGSDAGPGALTLDMSPDERRAAAARALEAVPGAVGANNHMGSAVSADLPAMREILGVLQDRRLFFVDSRTSPESVGYTVARELGMPAAERQVFLDNERTEEAITRQLEELAKVARERGGAVAIAHPYPETLAVLARELPRLREAGFRFVRVSELLTRG